MYIIGSYQGTKELYARRYMRRSIYHTYVFLHYWSYKNLYIYIYAIGPVKPMYACFNTISGQKAHTHRLNTIEGRRLGSRENTLSEADCGLETLYMGVLSCIRSGTSHRYEGSTLTSSLDPMRLAITNNDNRISTSETSTTICQAVHYNRR